MIGAIRDGAKKRRVHINMDIVWGVGPRSDCFTETFEENKVGHTLNICSATQVNLENVNLFFLASSLTPEVIFQVRQTPIIIYIKGHFPHLTRPPYDNMNSHMLSPTPVGF